MAIGDIVVEFVGQCVLEAVSYLTGRAVGADPKRARDVGVHVLLAALLVVLFVLTLKYS